MPSNDASQVLSTVVDELRRLLPDDKQEQLASFASRVKETTNDPKAEWHRAFACAKWATKVAALPERSAVMAGIKRALEAVRGVEKAIGGELTDLGEIPFGWSVSPSFELEMTWVYEAIRAAQDVAAKSGWDAVPWPDLLDRLLAVPG